MTPPLSKTQLELLQKLYYKDGMLFGRDKTFAYVSTNYPDIKLSRRQIADWLKAQEINQIHRNHEQAKSIKSTVLNKPYEQVGIDLVDMSNFEVRGFKCLFNAVDLFSRKMYSVPMKSKTDKEALTALKKIVKQIPELKSVRSDNGSEFKNKLVQDFLQKQNIKQVFSTPHTPQSNGGIERANQTLKRLIHKSIELNDNFDWAKQINKLTNNMNTTIIDKINETPNQIEKNDSEEFLTNIKEKDIKKKKNNIATQKYFVRQMVRIFLPSDKMKSINWSSKIYQIEKVFKPQTEYTVYEYKLKGLTKRFKEEDLQHVSEVQNRTNQPELFDISKIVKPVVRNNKKHQKYNGKATRTPQ